MEQIVAQKKNMGKLKLSEINDWFLLGLFFFPSYFGIRLGFFDLTALRFFEVYLLIIVFRSVRKKRNFIRTVKDCSSNIWILIYMTVVVYTNLIHPSITTIFYWLTNCVLVFYCTAYLIQYEYGIEGFLDKLRMITWIIAAISLLELVVKFPPFSLLDTLGKSSINSRFGNTRIMGNCTTTNGFGMYLMILFPLMCYDWHKKRMDLRTNKWLLLLIAIDVLVTGSRLSVGTLGLALVLCFFMQPSNVKKKEMPVFLAGIPAAVILLIILHNTSFVRNILCTFFSAVDEILGTEYAVQFGADATVLYNSSYYRELLWKNTIFGGWLNPLLGRGGNYSFGMFIEGYRIYSCDNFYVGQYITYAWPGVITWLLMSFSFLKMGIKQFTRHHDMLAWAIIVSIVCYFISLWYLDQLQTFPYMMAVFALAYSHFNIEKNKSCPFK